MITLTLTRREALALHDWLQFPGPPGQSNLLTAIEDILASKKCPYLCSVRLQLQAGIDYLNNVALEDAILSKAIGSPFLEVPMPEDWQEAFPSEEEGAISEEEEGVIAS